MYLKISKTPVIALIVGMYLELSVRNGNCDDRNPGPYYASANKADASLDSLSKSKKGAPTWKGWDDWIPPARTPKLGDKSRGINNAYAPVISSATSSVRRSTKGAVGDKGSGHPNHFQASDMHNKVNDSIGKDNLGPANLVTSILRHLFTYWTTTSSKSRVGRTVYLDSFKDRQEGASESTGESKRGVIDWLSRLIGVQGKTLGEFLREYQVHVLYDLAFTFFKWIFFLYAGLLIP